MTDSRDDARGGGRADVRDDNRAQGRPGRGDGAAGGGVDLSGAPLAYPGRMIPRSVRLRVLDGREEPLDADAARHGFAGRTPVLAVGSNASAGVMLWKLRRGGAGGEVPLVRARVRNLLVAPSAHVARAGFVPAAPAHVDGAVSEVVIGWLDRVQLDCVDRTEPNYRRVDLAAGDYPLEPRSVVPNQGFGVYESVWGVLGDAGAARPLPGQTELAAWFAARGLSPWSEGDAAEVVARLAGSLDLRMRCRTAFRTTGLATDSGLKLRRGR